MEARPFTVRDGAKRTDGRRLRMNGSMTTVSAGKAMQTQVLPTRRINHVGWLQALVAALFIAVVTIGVRAAFVRSAPKTGAPTISVDHGYVVGPHGPNQLPKRLSTQAAQSTSGGSR
jgi:hypothetical protein